MKILRIIARLNVGGPARHVVWLTAGLSREEFETLLVAGVVPPGEDNMGYFAAESGVTPFIIPEMSREISPKDVVTVWKIYRLMRRERPELVHTHTAKAGTVGRVAGFFYRWLTPSALVGKPLPCFFIHTYHGHIFHSYYGAMKTRLFLLIEKTLARLVTDRIVVISRQQFQEIHEKFGVGRREQFAVIPLGLDLTQFNESAKRRKFMREELELADNDILVGIVGRITEIKNHEMFLRAAARCSELLKSQTSAPRVRFVVIGDGPVRKKLEVLAEELGADVLFTGTRSDPENFYPALDIVALTSLNEGTPLTLIEAMANGRAVISTGVGGVVDLLGTRVEQAPMHDSSYTLCERGLSVPSNDVEGFARGLVRLIEDGELRESVSKRGRSFVEEKYSKDRLLKDMMSLYRSLVATESETLPAGISPKHVAASREHQV